MPLVDGDDVPDEVLDELKAWFMRAGEGTGRKSKIAAELEDQEAPAWLGLTPAERDRAVEFLARVSDEYPATSISELIWCLAADAVRPGRRGRKSKWLGLAGVAFVHEVDRELEARGLTRRDRKALRQVIAKLKRERPGRYGETEDRLRDAYYDALPRARFILGA
jgi:hypothetical protein